MKSPPLALPVSLFFFWLSWLFWLFWLFSFCSFSSFYFFLYRILFPCGLVIRRGREGGRGESEPTPGDTARGRDTVGPILRRRLRLWGRPPLHGDDSLMGDFRRGDTRSLRRQLRAESPMGYPVSLRMRVRVPTSPVSCSFRACSSLRAGILPRIFMVVALSPSSSCPGWVFSYRPRRSTV